MHAILRRLYWLFWTLNMYFLVHDLNEKSICVKIYGAYMTFVSWFRNATIPYFYPVEKLWCHQSFKKVFLGNLSFGFSSIAYVLKCIVSPFFHFQATINIICSFSIGENLKVIVLWAWPNNIPWWEFTVVFYTCG